MLDVPDDSDRNFEVSATPDSDSATLSIKVVDDQGFPVGPSTFFGDGRDEREPGASVSTVVVAGPFGADRVVINALGRSSDPGDDVSVLVGELDTFEFGRPDRQLVVVYSSDPEATITRTMDAS